MEETEGVKATSRNRVILPYLRRLFETKKSAMVTLKRAENASRVITPDEEIKRVFFDKMSELLNVVLLVVFHLCRRLRTR